MARYGSLTGRELHRHIRGFGAREIKNALEAMVAAGRLTEQSSGRTKCYALPLGYDHSTQEDRDEVPF